MIENDACRVRAAAFVLTTLIAAGVWAQGHRLQTTMFHGMELTYEVVNGLAIHAGDIVLGTAEEAAAHAPGRVGSSLADLPQVRRVHPVHPSALWPGGIIPYVIDDDVPTKEAILRAMDTWNTKTAVTFRPRTTERDYLHFIPADEGGACYGTFGRGFDGGEVIVRRSEPCGYNEELHELGHMIGLGHEQQRYDRDRHLRVYREEIHAWGGEAGTGAWEPYAGSATYGDIGPYDYRSVMHYSFTSDDMRRHEVKPMAETIPPGMPFGNTTELSPGDIDSVARLYGRQPRAWVVSTNPAGLEIVVDGVRTTAPAAFRWEPGSEHTLEVPSPQFAPGSRFLFGRWSDDGDRIHRITATPDTTLYQANFVVQHQVSTSVEPPGAGAVTVSPASPDGYYTLRSPIRVSATPAAGSDLRFARWEVQTDFYWSWFLHRWHGESSNPARSFVLDGLSYRAHFVEGPLLRVDSNISPVPIEVNGWWVTTPAAFPAAWFAEQDSVVVAARPIEGGRRSYRHRFRSWSDGGEETHAVEVSQTEDTVLTLTLDPEYRLTTRSWWPGAIDVQPLSDDGYYAPGTAVRVRASARPPYEFVGWFGDVSGRNPSTRVVMNDGQFAEAVFTDADELRLNSPTQVRLRWDGGRQPPGRKFFVRPPADATELEIEVLTETATPDTEAGLFVTYRSDPWVDRVRPDNADLVLRDGEVGTVSIPRPPDRWPAGYFILVRGAESTGAGSRRLEGSLVARVGGDRDRNPPNRPPAPAESLPDREMMRDDTLDLNVSRAFADPDGDSLTWAASSAAPDVVTVTAAGARVTLTAVSIGAATIGVTATDPGGLSAIQSFTVTVADRPSAPFTDDPVRPGVTPVRAVHFTELRTRIDGLRQAAGLAPFGWTDPVLRAGVTPVRLAHLTELRQALGGAYRAAGRTPPRWTDAAPTGGATPIRAAHLTELRAAVVALE